ncbi:MAG: type I-C CRISPR-associated protein Cas8c/Csd1 [Desulfarculaceae bacterium]|nr:type I-C CRISPR-associated protein Cas8c/Csd1 [Desulfarculaceae bacterium]
MLEHLKKYGEQVGLEPEPGFKVKHVKWAIVCDPGGRYLGVSQLGDAKQGKRNAGLEFKKAPDLTQPQMVSGPDNCRHFLADALSVVTLLGISKPGPNDLAKHEFFKDLLRQVAGQAPELEGLAQMLDDPSTLEAISRDLEQGGAKTNDSVTFQVGDGFPLNSQSWHRWWRGWWQEHCPLKLDQKPMVDFLSGREAPPLLSHYKISGLAGVGGQPTGDALASFDKEAFQSYGLAASANAAFSAESAIAYAEPLNHLIRETGRVVAGVRIVHWFKECLEHPEEEDPFAWLFEGDPGEARQAQAQARGLLDSIRTGKREKLGRNHFYAMTLSGAAGRVMLRDWMEGSFQELAASIDTWFDQLSMVRLDSGELGKAPKLIAVLAATVRDLDEINPPQVVTLYRGALNRRLPLPRWALAKTVLRARADVLRGESPRYTRMGLIKACLQRNPKAKGGEQLSPYLNEDHPEPAYQCGRLMAVYAALQRSALGDVGAGVVQRFYAAASATPALVLGRLARLSQFHLNKLDGGYWYESLLASIWERIDHQIPATLDLEEQGLFALGYYQQMAEMRRPKKKAGEAAEAPDTESADKE